MQATTASATATITAAATAATPATPDTTANPPTAPDPPAKRRCFRTSQLSPEEGALRHIARKCTLHQLLRAAYRPLKPIFREFAEANAVLERDARNLANMHVRVWLEEGQEVAKFPPLHDSSYWVWAYKLVGTPGRLERGCSLAWF